MWMSPFVQRDLVPQGLDMHARAAEQGTLREAAVASGGSGGGLERRADAL